MKSTDIRSQNVTLLFNILGSNREPDPYSWGGLPYRPLLGGPRQDPPQGQGARDRSGSREVATVGQEQSLHQGSESWLHLLSTKRSLLPRLLQVESCFRSGTYILVLPLRFPSIRIIIVICCLDET